MARIAVVHVPFYSHFRAATRLSEVLIGLGHEITAWAPAACREQTEQIGAEFRLHDPEMPEATVFDAFAAAIAATTERYAETLIDELNEFDPDLMIHDSQVPWARVAGDYLGIPRVVTHPMFPGWVPTVAKRPVIEQAASDAPKTDAQAEFDASWLSIAQRWGVELGSLVNVVHTATDPNETTLAFTTEKIVGEQGMLRGWHCIGPLMDPIPRRPPSGGRPLVYVCFGTSFNRRQHLFTSVIEALADEPFDVLISTGRGPVTSEDLAPLPSNIEVRDFVAAREVLAAASVHVSHCGCNSVHESLLAGVPLVCMPQAYDQFPLAGRVHQLEVGRIAQETPESVRSAVRHMINDPGPRARAREFADHLAAYDSVGKVDAVFKRVLSDHSLLNV